MKRIIPIVLAVPLALAACSSQETTTSPAGNPEKPNASAPSKAAAASGLGQTVTETWCSSDQHCDVKVTFTDAQIYNDCPAGREPWFSESTNPAGTRYLKLSGEINNLFSSQPFQLDSSSDSFQAVDDKGMTQELPVHAMSSCQRLQGPNLKQNVYSGQKSAGFTELALPPHATKLIYHTFKAGDVWELDLSTVPTAQ